MIDVLRSQLLALRTQIDAALAVIDTVSPSPPPESVGQCPHLEVENVGTFGAPEYRCTLCKASVPVPA
jgi:hypothetical protein